MTYEVLDIEIKPKPGRKRSKRFSVLVPDFYVSTLLRGFHPGGNYTICTDTNAN
jgi:hypothetical protein